MSSLSSLSFGSAVAPSVVLLAGYLITRLVIRYKRGFGVNDVNGPPQASFLLGAWNEVGFTKNTLPFFKRWNEQYGGAVAVYMPFGAKRIILYDPKAIINYFSKDTYEYQHGEMQQRFIENMAGRSLLWAEGDDHKRQRRTMTPAFSTPVIRGITPIFFETAYKLKSVWDSTIESDHQLIDVQAWMNKVTLDTIGLAGFSHEFQSLDGKGSIVATVFDALSNANLSTWTKLATRLTVAFPWMGPILPTQRGRLIKAQNRACGVMAEELLARAKASGTDDHGKHDRSVMSILLKAESGTHLSKVEVRDTVKLLLVAGYETTAVVLTAALIELAFNPDVQDRLRHELLEQYSSSDPTFDELSRELPYLDGVVHETLRIRPPVDDLWREAVEDDILPLSEPVRVRSGELVDRLTIPKGTLVTVPVEWLQRSPSLWGPDADQFKPERWFDSGAGLPDGARELQGHRHLLAFADGTRICLGKNFALTEFKAVLSVLIRNYSFELPDGRDTKLGHHPAIVKRLKVEGQPGCAVPMIVRKIE